ncbi:hypothetical protein VTK56DRAFT_1427 [Thermocarpiscus australiensis]
MPRAAPAPAPAARPYSSSAFSPAPQPQQQQQQQQPPAEETILLPPLSPQAANPPSTTRPPPLTLPARDPNQSAFKHYLATGMAYLTFYKTGLKHIWTNTRLLYSSSSPDAELQSLRPYPSTRADLHLRRRWRHDVRRLPLFALVLLVCGEFTPLVVLAVPRIVPLPCRIPRQVEKLLRAEEAAREEGRREVSGGGGGGGGSGAGDKEGDDDSSFSLLSAGQEEGRGTTAATAPLITLPVASLAKILGLRTPLPWTPSFVLAPRVQRRLRFLAVDDALLIQAGGAAALVADEVRLACADRGIDVLGRSEEELRAALGKWLRLTDARRLGEQGSEKARIRLLLAREREWHG